MQLFALFKRNSIFLWVFFGAFCIYFIRFHSSSSRALVSCACVAEILKYSESISYKPLNYVALNQKCRKRNELAAVKM